ncbi:Glycoside hydrolase/deacetylase [Mycena indigotica]|uniref:Glycoside hydrolase/deacetylase n=1 Tax=Mycena indigotica TaxID=2126181 RepID=A0A8H6VUQ6_9AGAR|nr:Glycoside hydrolase/deacetylase [Mycena indigotica]KAF7294644.1 Glycoside hydrolase/deacetylase [Mycena indigotica]
MADVQYAFGKGHQVASHTWSHPTLTSLSADQIHDNMYRIEEAFSRILGIRPAFMRPPFGAWDSNVQSVSAARGQSIAMWDADTKDADGGTVASGKAVLDGVANANAPNAIVLAHETVSTTPSELVPYAISLFKNKGYQLVTLAECLGVSPYQVVGVPQQPMPHWTCDGTPKPGLACGGNSGISCQTGTPIVASPPNNDPPTPEPLTNQYIHPMANSGKCLAVASNSDGAAVTVQDCQTSNSQAWTITGTGLISIYGNKCLDVPSGSTALGTKLQVWTCSQSNANQQWTLGAAQTLQWTGKSRCLDLTDGSVANGNRMQIWSCANNQNQQFTRTDGPGSGGGGGGGGGSAKTIRPNKSGSTCLSAVSNNNGAAVVAQPCVTGAANQQWTQNGGTLLVHGNKCLDVTDGNTSNGAKLQIWACNPGQGNAAQQWTVSAARAISWNGRNKCVDLTDGRTTTGNRIQTWDCSPSSPGANQIWNLV